MGAYIEAVGLAKRYGDHQAVDNVDLSIEQGSFFGIIGPNGAGKTTLLEIMEGIRQPDSGTSRIAGLDVWPRNTELLPKIGVQFQGSAFFPKLTAAEQIQTFADLYGAPLQRCEELLDQFGLTEKANTRTQDLSGGQAQRLSIACSLVHDPELVFLDEPTAALDPQARRNLWDTLRQINREGRTVVLTTHSMEEAETLCDRVAIMDHGKILTVDSPRALIAQIDAPHRITVEQGVLSAANAQALPGVSQVEEEREQLTMITDDPAAVLTALAQEDALAGVGVAGASLEDVFLDLTGREYRA
ncbi:ABC transporter ATP-binding protein [Yimella sp. cx-573]|nr:ABC transporter ATP-binding protein [Yimella sp. cx-573]